MQLHSLHSTPAKKVLSFCYQHLPEALSLGIHDYSHLSKFSGGRSEWMYDKTSKQPVLFFGKQSKVQLLILSAQILLT